MSMNSSNPDDDTIVTVTVTATIVVEYTMTVGQARQAFGTTDPAAIAAAETVNCAESGDYFISLLETDTLSDTYQVAVTVGPSGENPAATL